MNDNLRNSVHIRAYCLGKSLAWVYAHPDAEVDAPTAERIAALNARLRQGEPFAYLTGTAAFHEICLTLTPQALVPRPETELIVEVARREIVRGGLVLELGTGSGAIALALAKARPDLDITATDASDKALACARENARQLAQAPRFVCADWFKGVRGNFDAILSNPPYVASNDACLQVPPLSFEPREALDGGPDGLDALRAIIAGALPRLRSGGMLVLEHGCEQGARVREMLEKRGFANVETRNDLAGHERVSIGRRA